MATVKQAPNGCNNFWKGQSKGCDDPLVLFVLICLWKFEVFTLGNTKTHSLGVSVKQINKQEAKLRCRATAIADRESS